MVDKDLIGIESSDVTKCPTCGRDGFASATGVSHHHAMAHGESLVEIRFWPKVDVGDEDECWVWRGSVKETGYGLFQQDGEALRAHRVAYELVFEDPGEKHVLHHCDNPSCVNPGHLYLGTHQDNMQDMVQRDRIPRGERAGNAKLTKDEVREIRQRYDEEDILQKELADEFDISTTNVSSIITGKWWAHLEDA